MEENAFYCIGSVPMVPLLTSPMPTKMPFLTLTMLSPIRSTTLVRSFEEIEADLETSRRRVRGGWRGGYEGRMKEINDRVDRMLKDARRSGDI